MKITGFGAVNVSKTANVKKNEPEASEVFSEMLDNMKKGKAPQAKKDVESADTSTITRVLSDGSTLIMVINDEGQIISEMRTRSAHPDKNPTVIGTNTERNGGSENPLNRTENADTGAEGNSVSEFTGMAQSMLLGTLGK